MEPGIPNASLHEMNGQNRHELHRRAPGNSIRQQVRDYKRSERGSKRRTLSNMIDAAIGYELIGSVIAIAVVGTVFTVAIR